ncbi:hypothetical protein [Flavobacterium rhizosphaerae]|uniref:Uncharacterized protein n=1 Tax=Flavobacterium rhizosphaerae TaxID=3163298 RepID=A0ABW8YWU0_9FLAO
MHVEYVGRDAIVQTDKLAFTYQTSETPRELREESYVDDLNWNSTANYIGDYIVYPYGNRNDLPEQIRNVVMNNSLAPGIITKKTQLLWGSGPKLYKEVFENRELVRDWQDNTTIQAWLDTWDFEAYITKLCVDYHHMEGVYSNFIQSRGSRIGKRFIHSLDHVSVDKARLASLRSANTRKPTHVLVNDWSFAGPQSLDCKVYDKFDFTKPFASKNAILYSNMYSFCTDYYTVPDLYGSLEWLRRSTAIPLILKALSKNAINLKYHIISPAKYWENKEKDIKSNCEKMGQEYKKEMLQACIQETLEHVGKILSDEHNTGKFWHTVKEIEHDGVNLIEHGWEIKVIDNQLKDFVDSQIAIANRADRAVSAGIGLHGSLGNLSDQGKSDSGSEQLYALKNYMATGIDIPEMIIMKAINYALKANFPQLGLKMGFYHMQPQKEQDVNPENRLKNSI